MWDRIHASGFLKYCMQSIEVLLEMSENVYWYQYKQLNPYQPPDYAWSKRNNLRKVQKAKRKTKYVREETKCGSNIIKPVYAKHRGSLGNVRKCVLVNPVRTKELTNICVPGKDENVRLSPPRLMSLEEAIGYVASDELIEVTQKAVRLRKWYLDVNKRKMMRCRLKE
ncbi:uncharacterized protein LOC120258907 isoform X3 [Dioscorea cayenensis subsp. rotundata]|uniref:Uncharacterized protein LOC120258907 isoform X3 n=1 Tax=Dioscorea cayennensis subsp. rotundata TaxID=55577 RepID=A0AB40B6K3_DIOCR|nr:uncharacterized protein LOC120258907 isoform X3 [Dioscorea cayenensis subsp. rotundata]